MHELPITESVLSIALDAATQNGGGRITAIHLVIGELTSIVDYSVQIYFDILIRDTLAAGAVLNFQRKPAIAACQECGHQTPVPPPLGPQCPHCHSPLGGNGWQRIFCRKY
jgi:hydrogenase nickel incorporation protein HypA/HybF